MEWRKQLVKKFGWENQESVNRWLDKLKTKPYAEDCLWLLELHCTEIGKTPDELVEERIEQISALDPRVRAEAEDMVLRIYGKLAEKKRGKAINYFRKMKSFYKHNYCALGCSDPGYDVEREVQDRRVLEKLNTEKIREICEKAQLQVRFGILALAESGARIGAIMSLTYGDVKDDLEKEVIPSCIWLKQRTRKKGKTYPSFICGDAVKLLKLILRERGELKDDIPIFTVSRNAIHKFLERFNSGIHPHLFRKRFQIILEDNGVPLNWVDRLMGHVPRGAQGKTYSLPPIEKLREYYIKAIPELTIYGSSKAPFNGELKEYMAKALSKVLSKYLNQSISEKEIQKALEEL